MKEPLPKASQPDESALVERARKGDKEAYRELVTRYQDRVFSLVLSMVQNREQAEDSTQEIFIKAYFALPSFQSQSTFYTWIYRIAANHCLDFLRKHRPDQWSLDRPLKDGSESTLQDTLEAPRRDLPEASLESSHEAAALLNRLDPDERLILTLRELEGHSYEELAALMNCPVNTIKSRLNRARESLKGVYEKIYGPLPAEARNIEQAKIVSESRKES